MSRLIHEGFESPADPASTDRTQPAWAECPLGQIVLNCTNPLSSYRVPMIGTVDGKRIKWNAVVVLWHERRSHSRRGPACSRLVIHCYHLAPICEAHPENLHRMRSRAVEAHVVLSRTDHLDRFTDCFGSERSGYRIIAIKATAECATEQIAPHHNLVFTTPQSLGQYRQDQCLPLIPGVDFEDTILFESQCIDWLQREMHYGARCIGLLDRVFCRKESRIQAGIVDDQRASLRICNQLCRTLLQVLLRDMSRLA